MRVVVTRPQPQADEWVARLTALGVPAVALPLLDIADAADPAPVRAAWAELPTLELVMFVSPSAVERFFAPPPLTPGDGAAMPPAVAAAHAPWPRTVLAGSTGPGTQQALRRAGVPEAQIVSPPADAGQFDSEALWQQLRQRGDWRGARVLIVRGEDGRNWLGDTLAAHGAEVRFVQAYRRAAPQPDAAGRQVLARALAEPAAHCWLFSSSEAARHLPLLAPGADWSAARALATHPRIAATARCLGFGRVELVEVTPQAVAAALAPSIQSARP